MQVRFSKCGYTWLQKHILLFNLESFLTTPCFIWILDDNRILESMFPSDILPKVYPKEPTPQEKAGIGDVLDSNIFNVMLNRRSQRNFEEREIEDWKIDIIFAAADAPNHHVGCTRLTFWVCPVIPARINIISIIENLCLPVWNCNI